jgi:hypothetical protein
MNGIEIIVLLLLFITGGAGYFVTKGQKSLKEFKTDFDNNAEVQEQAEPTEELYNKDLRPIEAKKSPKKEKVIEVVPEIIEKVEEMTTPEVDILNIEVISEEIKAVNVEGEKPKKKRKYYPRKKKQEDN